MESQKTERYREPEKPRYFDRSDNDRNNRSHRHERTDRNDRHYDDRHSRSRNKNDNLDEAIKAYSGNNENNVEIDNEDEIKAVLIENIDALKEELSKDNVDTSKIQEVSCDSNLDTIKKVHNVLRKKYDRTRCNTLGTEIILAGAQGLEYVLNGKNKWGPYSPDVTGWHNTIRPKLRRMRYETSELVSTVMNDYNIGPFTRIALELFPNLVLYSHMRREQHGRTNYSPTQMSDAFEDLRQFDN